MKRKKTVLIFLMTTMLISNGCHSNNNKVKSETIQTTSKPIRIATLPLGAELTGLFVNKNGDLFFNVQHPSKKNPPPFDRAAIGVVTKANFHQLPTALNPVPLPSTKAEKQMVRLAVGEYKILANGGDKIGELAALGVTYSTDGRALTDGDVPDFNAFISTADDSNRGVLFTAWESKPGAMTRLSLTREAGSPWQVDKAIDIDFKSIGGTWTNCFGTLSPWNTPLASEELYFDNTSNWRNLAYQYISGVKKLESHLGYYPNPYRYGYIIEIEQPLSETPRPKKLFSLGRFSHENSVVMPDKKTVYLSDDGAATVLFKFVADTPADLDSGVLYAAKVQQDRNPTGSINRDEKTAGFDIEWIKLAKSSGENIEKWIAEYDGKEEYIGDRQIVNWAQGKAKDDRVAFLESRKAARAKGATAEFRKLEGINIHYDEAASGKHPYLYLAVSNIDKTMSDLEGDIQLNENPCGAIYTMRLDQQFDVKRMEPVLVGGPYQSLGRKYGCDEDNISNPDNLVVLPGGYLLVGEDAPKRHHENNMLWLIKSEHSQE